MVRIRDRDPPAREESFWFAITGAFYGQPCRRTPPGRAVCISPDNAFKYLHTMPHVAMTIPTVGP